METPVVVAVAIAAAALGVLVGLFLATRIAPPQAIRAAQAEGSRIVAEARERQKALILEAKEDQLRIQREA